MVICLKRGADDLRMVHLMPLSSHHLLFQKNPEWFTFLVLAYQVVLEKGHQRDVVVVAVVCTCEMPA